MQMKEAWAVLGLPCNATPLQVKIAYKRKALENHPDRFPAHVKLEAEARFKHVLPSPPDLFDLHFRSIHVPEKWSASNVWIWRAITVLKLQRKREQGSTSSRFCSKCSLCPAYCWHISPRFLPCCESISDTAERVTCSEPIFAMSSWCRTPRPFFLQVQQHCCRKLLLDFADPLQALSL